MNDTTTPRKPTFGPRRCPVYLRLPWIGTGRFEQSIKQVVRPAYAMCEVNVCFTSQPMFRSTLKDCLPTQQISNVIYLFQCRCGSRYVGKTTQRLETRMKQHAPAALIEKRLSKDPTSASGEHLVTNAQCLDEFDSASSAKHAPATYYTS